MASKNLATEFYLCVTVKLTNCSMVISHCLKNLNQASRFTCLVPIVSEPILCSVACAMTDEPNPSSKRLASSAGVAGTATMSSRLLGLIREQVLASLFGAGNAMDAFNVAFRIPNLVRDLFAEGAMSAAFVPTFTKELATKGKEAAWRLGSLVLNSLLVITGLLVVAGLIFQNPWLKLLQVVT